MFVFTLLVPLMRAAEITPLEAPETVIATLVRALGNANSPAPNAGVYKAYQLASPANRLVAGPYGRFLRIVKVPQFASLLHPDPDSVQFGSIEIDSNHAQQTVALRSQGQSSAFLITLTRQASGPSQGVWLVDGVAPLVASQGKARKAIPASAVR